MFTITTMDNANQTIIMHVEDRTNLCAVIGMLERDQRIQQFKVEIPGHTIKNLYTELGVGNVEKFVSVFTYHVEI